MFSTKELLAVLPEIDHDSLVETPKSKASNDLKLLNTDFDYSNEYPYLSNTETINFIKKSKVMFIMRGLPGSGKSTLAKAILNVYSDKSPVLCAGDLYFTNQTTGEYNFDRNKLQDAHEYARKTAENACMNDVSPVLIDNTNVLFWEMKPYIDIAFRYNYIIILSEPRTPWKFDVKILTAKNSHHVPSDVISRRLKDFRPIIPVYFGWFLNEEDSRVLTDSAFDAYSKCLQEIKDFNNDMTRCNKTGKSNQRCFTVKSKLLHCTSKFCGKDVNSKSNLDYFKRITVPLNIGKTFKLRILGFTITQETIGAQVDLYDDLLQLSLWDNELSEGEMNSILCKAGVSKRNLKTGSRAHVTIGLANNAKAVQTGFDLISIMLIMKNNPEKIKTVELDDAKINYLNSCRIYIELNNPIFLDSIFTFGFR